MAEDNANPITGAGAAALALGTAAQHGHLDPRAAAYLEKQARLTELQISDLEREDALRHWSLRVRHVSDVMKLTFELAGAFIAIVLVTLICVTLWKAAHDDSLVIQSFSVPPDMAARGLTGEAIAAQVQDRLAALQDVTLTGRPANSYASNWGDDVRVQIPETGMSIGEFYRLLVSWFGHQTRISGEVFRTQQGMAIAVRTTGQPGDTVRGTDGDLDGLVQRAAEAIYARTQPYRYAMYLVATGAVKNSARITAILEGLARTGTPLDKAWSYMGLSTSAEFTDPIHAPAINRKAVSIAPDFALAYQNIGGEEQALGHDEAALAPWRKDIALLSNGTGGMTQRARDVSLPSVVAALAQFTGDFAAALHNYEITASLPGYAGITDFANHALAYDLASLHETRRARLQWMRRTRPQKGRNEITLGAADAQFIASLQDWAGVLALKAGLEGVLIPNPPPPLTAEFVRQTLTRSVWPYAAGALAHTGDMKGADALIARTPLDCLICVRVRGELATMRGDWAEAARWYAMASAQAPSIPFADNDWGGMLLAKGDLDGAIAKFGSAHKKGPHYADPLEMWGEALIAKNRSDLALAKFEEANRYAPNWGRLHLKWGETLWWSGKKDEAHRQLALAGGLDLTAAEKSERARVIAQMH
jgi:tetratricopeptide (TPR) repeat protein